MTDLITKLEEAGEGSRALDGLIYAVEQDLSQIESTTFVLDINGTEHFQFRHPTKVHPGGPAALYVPGYKVPEYTTSIDAALALAERVLPGWFPAVEPRFFIDGEVVRWKTTLIRPLWDQYNPVTDEWFDRIENRTASTPALALCAAILRASEQERGG